MIDPRLGGLLGLTTKYCGKRLSLRMSSENVWEPRPTSLGLATAYDDDKQFALALVRATVLFRHAGCNLVVEPSDR